MGKLFDPPEFVRKSRSRRRMPENKKIKKKRFSNWRERERERERKREKESHGVYEAKNE